jgi:putative transposase
METIHTILRSNVGNRYLLYVNESLDKSMDIHSWNRESVKKVITLASVMNSYVEGTASYLKICGQTVRNNLKQQNPDDVLEYNESIIKAMKDMGAFKKPVIVAIDWHDIMYYGDPKAEGVKGTKEKKGTSWAYQFATASVVIDDKKFTIAVTPVAAHESIVEHVRRLLSEIFELGIKVKLLLLDAGYYSVKVIKLLNSSGIKFIMRMPDIGKFKDGDDLMYTSDSHKTSEQATFRVVAFNGRNRAGRTELFVFATNTDLKAKKIRKMFRKRWAIETSYRMINQFLPKTTSKFYSLRRLYFLPCCALL